MKTFIIAAITADGFIGRNEGHSADWTTKADKQVFVRLTKKAGTIVMGARTFATIGRALPERRNIVYTTHPESIAVEGVETTNERPKDLLERLEHEGITSVAICGGATIYTQFLQAGLVDELYLTVVPKLFGSGLALFTSQLNVDLTLYETTTLDGGTVLFHYLINQA